MKTEEIRTAFLEFFAARGHSIVASSSLIPAGNPTLLFANSGMVQFKDCFLGLDKRPYTRATTCQKSLRISGKHNDLENVGRTARHHTFFEMLGNFSFGDYFKRDAILFAWEFVTKELNLPKDRLWATVYEEDDEALELWGSLTDIGKGRVLRFGKADNFWQMGDTGPCGPCSEIFYYLGDNVAGQSEAEFRSTDGLYVEIWNLVFMQFDRDPKGTLTPLPKPSVDTGMGLERVATVKQGVRSNFDIDLFRRIMDRTEALCGKKYDGRDYTPRNTEVDQQYAIDVAHRVIADHVRAAAFLIADGINPSSDGRGYVLRRLVRRACRHGRVLGFRAPFLHTIALEVVDAMGAQYPELISSRSKIDRVLAAEEEKFLATLDTGISILTREVEGVKGRGSKILSGEVAFLLHDTYGFPLDLTEDLVRVHGLNVDSDGFVASMEKQRERSRAARAQDTDLILQRAVKPQPVRFVGFQFSEYESEVTGLFNSDGEVKVAREGQEIAVLTRETPFYGESGGQIGDTGSITSLGGTLEVIDTQKVGGDTIVHICRVKDGELAAGTRVRLAIDDIRRGKLRVNHSATHLLHYALRNVLGDHVKQSGSRVSERTLRFDFAHFEPITASQLEEVQLLVNQQIQSNNPVVTEVLSLEEARRSGATALFGEKYGDTVRVVQIGPFSRELCGGTHVGRSGDIGVLTVASEGGIAAGVRRVEAFSGLGALQELDSRGRLLRDIAATLRSGEKETLNRLEKLMQHTKQLEREVERLSQSVNAGQSADLTKQATVLSDGTKVIAHKLPEASPKQLREIADDLRSRIGSGCIALASVSEGKAILLTAVTDNLVSRFHAGNLMKEMATVVGSRGGGRADLAQAGGGDPTKIDQALARFQELLQ